MNGSRSHEVDVGSSLRTGVKNKAILSRIFFLLRPGPLPRAHSFYMRQAPERSSGQDQIWAPKNRVWRRYTPHKTSVKHSENGGRHGGTPSCRLALMGPNPCAHLHDPPSSLHRLPRQWVVALSSSKAGSLATLTYLKGYPTKIS